MQQQGFRKSHNDRSLLIKRKGQAICIAAGYVNDTILTGTDLEAIEALNIHLYEQFSTKDLGKLNYFLGIEVGYTCNGIILSQRKFTKEMLHDCGFDLPKKSSTPLRPLNTKLTTFDGDFLVDPKHYISLVGKLNFLTNTIPALAYTMQSFSQFMKSPRSSHQLALHHTLRYVQHTAGRGILLKASDKTCLHAFSNSGWASCSDS